MLNDLERVEPTRFPKCGAFDDNFTGYLVGGNPIYMQPVRYIETPAPKDRPFPIWQGPPQTRYRITSSVWSGEVGVCDWLIEIYGEARAVPFKAWGEVCLRIPEAELEELFARLGRHEVRKRYVESVRYERIVS
jgi:hypothetical protein